MRTLCFRESLTTIRQCRVLPGFSTVVRRRCTPHTFVDQPLSRIRAPVFLCPFSLHAGVLSLDCVRCRFPNKTVILWSLNLRTEQTRIAASILGWGCFQGEPEAR